MNELAPEDPGPANPQRLGWARLVGVLEEIDLYLQHHPRLINAKDIASANA
jgi:hypothetical protein